MLRELKNWLSWRPVLWVKEDKVGSLLLVLREHLYHCTTNSKDDMYVEDIGRCLSLTTALLEDKYEASAMRRTGYKDVADSLHSTKMRAKLYQQSVRMGNTMRKRDVDELTKRLNRIFLNMKPTP